MFSWRPTCPILPWGHADEFCHHVATIASQLHSGQNRAEQQFDLGLYQAWRFDHSLAVGMLSQDNLKGADQPVNALRRLVQFQATREDLRTLLSYSEDDFRGQVLRCLWIDQLVHRRERPTKEDLEWMRGFPPHLNTSWFAQHLERWASLLLTSGYKPAARAWAERLEREFLHVRAVPELIRRIELGQKPWGRAVYRFGKAMERSQVFVRRLGGTLARIGRGCGSGTADEGN